jgi:sensor domain CHASE-containing protein
MRHSRLSTKLIIYILSSAGVIFVTAFMYNLHYSQEAVMAKVAENARLLTMKTANKIEIVLKSVEKIPRNLIVVIEDHPYNQEELVSLLYKIIENNSEIFGIAIAFEPRAFDPKAYFYALYACWENQKIKISFLGDDSEQNYFYYDWYQNSKGRDNSLWSGPYRDNRGSNILIYTFSTPFYQDSNGDRRFRGVVAVGIIIVGYIFNAVL